MASQSTHQIRKDPDRSSPIAVGPRRACNADFDVDDDASSEELERRLRRKELAQSRMRPSSIRPLQQQRQANTEPSVVSYITSADPEQAEKVL